MKPLRLLVLLISLPLLLGGCGDVMPPNGGNYSASKRKLLYNKAHSYISDKEESKWARSQTRFFDPIQNELKNSLRPVFEGESYVGIKTQPIGCVVRVFEGKLLPRTYEVWTTVYFDLDHQIIKSISGK